MHFDSKLYEAFAEVNTCGTWCDPCKRFLLMEPEPQLPAHLPKGGMKAWSTWRPVKIEDDRRACIADIKTNYWAWNQLGLLERLKDDISGERIRSLVENVDPNTGVSWKSASHWIDSEFAKWLMLLGIPSMLLAAAVFFSLAIKDEENWLPSSQGAAQVNLSTAEANVTLVVNKHVLSVLKACGIVTARLVPAKRHDQIAEGDTIRAHRAR